MVFSEQVKGFSWTFTVRLYTCVNGLSKGNRSSSNTVLYPNRLEIINRFSISEDGLVWTGIEKTQTSFLLVLQAQYDPPPVYGRTVEWRGSRGSDLPTGYCRAYCTLQNLCKDFLKLKNSETFSY